MSINERNFFDNWKEFVIGKPDETILNHLDIIKNHTTLDGNLKYKSDKEVYKVFSLFITHNYGSHVYELVNFLKYLRFIEFPIYKIMVSNSSEITKEIKKIEFKKNNTISNQMTLKFDKHSFNLHYNRISIYIIMLDFIEEFLGLETLLSTDEKINELSSHEELKQISNNISKKLYNYLKNLLPTSYLQNLSTIISDQIIKEKNNESHNIVSEDISDQFILDFWINSHSIKKDFSIKTYSTAVDFCMVYRRSIDLNKSNHSKVVGQINEKDPWDNLSKEQVDNLLDQLVDNSADNIFHSIDYIEKTQDKKINLLKKNQINELKKFSKYQNTSLSLPLTILRSCVFGSIQNKIIEAERRKKLNLEKEFINLDENCKFRDQYRIYEDLITNIDFLKGVLFYKLWTFRRIETFQFIRDYLTGKEESLFNNFLKMNKSYFENTSLNKNERENAFTKFESFIEDKSENNFQQFTKKLNILKTRSKNFRRSGVDFKDCSYENINTLETLIKVLFKIKEFLSKFLKKLNPKLDKLEFYFAQDKDIFFKHFYCMYSEKEKEI
mgnify:FL=1